MRGRKPKATALKILERCREDRINRDEPSLPFNPADAPSWLTGLALEHWNEIAPMLAKARVLTDGDRANLALMCECYAEWREDIRGAWKAKDLYRRLSCEFGLTPSSRSRIKVPSERPKDELEAFLEVKKA